MRLLLFLFSGLFLTGCAIEDRRHRMIVSVPEQRMLLLDEERPVASYPISTSKFGLGDRRGSNATPLGSLKVARKIGAGARPGAVFKDRRPTGEVLAPDAPGRDPIVTRILWLEGLDPENRNAYARYIYIHGTPEERRLGTPASYGCIRMGSRDVIDLFARIGRGARVEILDAPLPRFQTVPPPLSSAPEASSPSS